LVDEKAASNNSQKSSSSQLNAQQTVKACVSFELAAATRLW
jgi:hypothetical protein